MTFKCDRNNDYQIWAQVSEYDDLRDDYGKEQAFTCNSKQCKKDVTYKDTGDGPLNYEYELTVHIKHTCTADRLPKSITILNGPTSFGVFTPSVGKDTEYTLPVTDFSLHLI